METKKTDRANIEKHRIPFILTAFLFVGGMTLASFTFKNSLNNDELGMRRGASSEIVFQTEPKEIIPPKDEPQDQVVTPPQENTPIDSINKTTVPDPTITVINPPIVKVNVPIVHIEAPIEDFPDQEAMFPGGAAELQKWIASTVVYPQTAIEMGDQGRVYLSFVVEVDGSISNVSIERGVSEELDREAKRVTRKMPNWVPGETKGKKVRTRCRLPIIFELD